MTDTEHGADWRLLAADMIDAGKISISDLSTEVEVQAASFVFDQGVLYLNPEGRAKIAAVLRSRATAPTPESPL